jgi:hypothetical protein
MIPGAVRVFWLLKMSVLISNNVNLLIAYEAILTAA